MCHRQNTLWPWGRILFKTFYCLPLSSLYKTIHRHWIHIIVCRVSYRLPFIFIAIYGVVCVQLAHFSIGDWKDISTAHVIIIIKSEVSTFPIVIIVFRGIIIINVSKGWWIHASVNWVTDVSGNGLSPFRCLTIMSIIIEFLLIKKIYLPFCSGLLTNTLLFRVKLLGSTIDLTGNFGW